MKPFENPFFGPLAKEAWAQEVWKWLNDPIQVARLEAVSELGHPALEGVVQRLEADFGDRDGENRFGPDGDRNRQLVGAMIKQVMGDIGWVVDRQGLKMALGHQFTVATRYKKVAQPTGAGSSDGTGPFLAQVASRYGVAWNGRHYIEIPCDGVTIGVDDLKGGGKVGTRRVHAFSNKKNRTEELSHLDALVRKHAGAFPGCVLTPVNRLGETSHERRYVGWEWTHTGTDSEEVEMACKLVDALREGWLGRIGSKTAAGIAL